MNTKVMIVAIGILLLGKLGALEKKINITIPANQTIEQHKISVTGTSQGFTEGTAIKVYVEVKKKEYFQGITKIDAAGKWTFFPAFIGRANPPRDLHAKVYAKIDAYKSNVISIHRLTSQKWVNIRLPFEHTLFYKRGIHIEGGSAGFPRGTKVDIYAGQEKDKMEYQGTTHTSYKKNWSYFPLYLGKAGKSPATIYISAVIGKFKSPIRTVKWLGEEKLVTDKDIHPQLADSTTLLEKIANKLITDYSINTDYKDLRKRLKFINHKYTDIFRIPEIDYLHRNPFQMEKVSTDILASTVIKKKEQSTFMPQLNAAIKLLCVKPPLTSVQKLSVGISVEQHLDQIEDVLTTANQYRNKAFSALSQQEMTVLYTQLPSLEMDSFEPAVHDEHAQVLQLVKKVDYHYLYLAAVHLQQLLSSNYTNYLRQDFIKSDVDIDQEIIIERQTKYGSIVIGGIKDHWYKDENVAVLIDLGGNDFYSNNSGSSTSEIGCSILIDLAGDDAYESTVDYAQGTGYLGIGILGDLEGDDSYVGLRWCQGTSLVGIGVLLDMQGKDIYRAHSHAQGTALWGIALNVDLRGDDRYESHLLSQGVGMPFGVGILFNEQGNDHYYCKGTKPSGYGNRGIFDGYSQGFGIGFRRYASGGVGILQDTQGKDKYEAGNFSQGGGYYYGWGI
ncbi:hypothetical protein [Candidatus Uabimicrobium sp. HlEnr_7]|uniref:hypothetical protein n=1 Tax=Candidatus Uabimicrobium helgolandensis TaxID=3095367 RepID=UPI003555E6E3